MVEEVHRACKEAGNEVAISIHRGQIVRSHSPSWCGRISCLCRGPTCVFIPVPDGMCESNTNLFLIICNMQQHNFLSKNEVSFELDDSRTYKKFEAFPVENFCFCQSTKHFGKVHCALLSSTYAEAPAIPIRLMVLNFSLQ